MAELLDQEILECTSIKDVMDVPMEKYNHNDSGLVNIEKLIGSVRMQSMNIKDNTYADTRSKYAISIKLP